MAPWHIEYFKLKEFEKTEAGRLLWPFPCPSPLQQVINLSCERCLPVSGGKEHLYLQRQSDDEKNPSKQVLLSFPHLITCSSYSWTHHISARLPPLHQPSHRNTQVLTVPSGLHFFMKAPTLHTTYIKHICMLSFSVNLSLFIYFSDSARDPTGWGCPGKCPGKHFPPLHYEDLPVSQVMTEGAEEEMPPRICQHVIFSAFYRWKERNLGRVQGNSNSYSCIH